MNTQNNKSKSKTKKTMGVTAVSIAAGVIGAAVIANSNFTGVEFNPDKYSKPSSKSNSDVLFDGVAYSAESDKDNSEVYSEQDNEQNNDTESAEENPNDLSMSDNAEAINEIRVGAVSENGSSNAVDAVFGGNGTGGGLPVVFEGNGSFTDNTNTVGGGMFNPSENPSQSVFRPDIENNIPISPNNSNSENNLPGNPNNDNSENNTKPNENSSKPSGGNNSGNNDAVENTNPSGSTTTPPPKKDDGNSGEKDPNKNNGDNQHSTNSGQPVAIKITGDFMDLCQGQSADSIFSDTFGRTIYLEFENGDRMTLRNAANSMAGFTLSGLSTANVTDKAVAKASYTYNSKTFTIDIPYSVSKWKLNLYRTEDTLWRSLTPDRNLMIYLDEYYSILKERNPQFYGWSEADNKTVHVKEYMMYSKTMSLYPRISMQQPEQADGSTVFKIPEGYTDVDISSFTDCSQYTEMEIPSSLQNINLDNISAIFPNLKTFKVSGKNSAYYAVDGVLYEGDKIVCVGAAKREISEFAQGVKVVGARAFENTKLSIATLPKTITVFEDEAFKNADIETLNITAEDYSLGSRVFYSDSGKGIKKVLSDALYVASIKNDSLDFGKGNTTIRIPDSKEDVIYQQYLMSWGLNSPSTSFLITETGAQNRNKISNNAVYSFFNKKNEYTLVGVSNKISGEFKADPNTVKIANNAFAGCAGITSITLGEKVRELDSDALYGLNNLGMIILEGKPPKIDDNTFAQIHSSGFKISVPYEYYEDYMTSWGDGIDKLFGENTASDIIEPQYTNAKNIDGALYIETGDGLVLIQVPRTVSEEFTIADGTYKIEKNAFIGNLDLLCVTIPETVKEIDLRAVSNGAKIGRVLVNSKTFLSLDAFGDSTVFVPQSMYDEYSSVYENVRTLAEKYTADKNGIIYCGNILFYVPTDYSGSITVPSDITEIYEGAFEDCKQITDVILNGNIENIGKEAFYNCYKLKNIDFSNSPIKSVGERAFYGCVSMKSVNLGEEIEEIGDEAFARCDALNLLNLGTGIKSIGKRAFYGCNSLETLNAMSSMNFAVFTKLQYIGEEAFASCPLISSVRFGAYEEIPEGCFDGCINLKEIQDFGGVKKISKNAFKNTGFESVLIPDDTVTEIGSGAFGGCRSLSVISIGNSVQTIAPDFADDNANVMLVLGSEAQIDGISEAIARKSAYAKIFTSEEHKEFYSSLLGAEHVEAASGQFRVSDGNLYVQDEEKILHLIKVNVNTDRFSMILNERVTSVAETAFEDCDKLEYIELSKAIEKIPEYLFRDCTKVKSIEFKTTSSSPSSNIAIGDGAFSGCRSLLLMDIPNNVVEVGEKLFMDDISLTSVSWGAYDGIKADTFNNCTALESFTITAAGVSGIKGMGDRAFFGCSSIKSIMGLDGRTQLTGLKEIGNSCFENCVMLEEMVLSNEVEKIGDRAFANCKSLSMIRIDSPNAQLGSHVFGDEIGSAFFGVSDVDAYISMWGEQLDREYGEGAAKKLIRSIDNPAIPEEDTETSDDAKIIKTEEQSSDDTKTAKAQTVQPTEDKSEESTEENTENSIEISTETANSKTEETVSQDTDSKTAADENTAETVTDKENNSDETDNNSTQITEV